MITTKLLKYIFQGMIKGIEEYEKNLEVEHIDETGPMNQILNKKEELDNDKSKVKETAKKAPENEKIKEGTAEKVPENEKIKGEIFEEPGKMRKALKEAKEKKSSSSDVPSTKKDPSNKLDLDDILKEL